MRTLTRYQQQQERAGGRFGRPLAPCRSADEMDDPTMPMQTECDEGRFASATYRVDPDAVASAIVARLLAGRTLPGPLADER